jgi:hypothetical protein
MLKIYRDFRQAMLQPNIWEGFWALSLEFDTRSEPYQRLLKEETMRGSASFRELSLIDFRFYQLLS